jgi:hypothetical protein
MMSNFVLGALPCQFGDTRQQRAQPALSANICLQPEGEGRMSSRRLTDADVHLGGVEATAR